MSLLRKALDVRRYDVAADQLAKGLEYCSDHGLELFRLYLLSHRARLYLAQGRWAQAADTADMVLRIPRTSISPRITALTVLGLVRARRGDPGHRPLLDEAWDLAQPTGEIGRLGLVAAARAEAAWLGCDPDGVASATELALAVASRCSSAVADELGVWRHRAGLGAAKPVVPGSPHGLQLAGSWDAARALWVEAGCPYEAALCLADADDEAGLRLALEELLGLEARPAAAIVARRLRDRGVMSLPRGPRATTRQNQYGLTAREMEVLALVNEGLRTARSPTGSWSPCGPSTTTSKPSSANWGPRPAPTPGPLPPRSGWLWPPHELGAGRKEFRIVSAPAAVGSARVIAR